jgi:hypothetical protein
MNTIIDNLCTLVETGKTPEALLTVEVHCGPRDLLLAAWELLMWLRRPIDRNLQFANELALFRMTRLLIASPELSLLFEVHEDSLQFRESIPTDEKMKIRGFVRSKTLGRATGPKRS